jgi:uncharacterized protein YceK
MSAKQFRLVFLLLMLVAVALVSGCSALFWQDTAKNCAIGAAYDLSPEKASGMSYAEYEAQVRRDLSELEE